MCIRDRVSVLNGENALCRVNSPLLGFQPDSCVITACDVVAQTYCYQDVDTAWFIYQSGATYPITISFLAGDLLSGDVIELYNGIDASAQLVYQGNYGGNLAGLSLSSSNPDDAITLRVVSNASGSCAGGQAAQPMSWTVGCGLVGMEEAATVLPVLFPNPADGVLYVRIPARAGGAPTLHVLDALGRMVLMNGLHGGAGGVSTLDISGLVSGRYTVRLVWPDHSWTGGFLKQ